MGGNSLSRPETRDSSSTTFRDVAVRELRVRETSWRSLNRDRLWLRKYYAKFSPPRCQRHSPRPTSLSVFNIINILSSSHKIILPSSFLFMTSPVAKFFRHRQLRKCSTSQLCLLRQSDSLEGIFIIRRITVLPNFPVSILRPNLCTAVLFPSN